MLTAVEMAALMVLTAGPPRPPDLPTQVFSQRFADNFCLSRDGRRLALGHWSIWDLPGRQRLLGGHTYGAHGMAYSPDGKLIAIGGNYAGLRVIDAATGRLHWDLTLEGHGNTVLQHVEFTQDGLLVTSSSNGLLRVWDVGARRGRALYCFPSPGPYDQAGQDEFLKGWHARAKERRPADEAKAFVVFKEKIIHFGQFTLSPDGKAVVVPTHTPDVLLIELSSGRLLKRITTKQESTHSVRFSPDGKMLAVGGEGCYLQKPWKGTIELWDVAAGKRIREWKGHPHTVMKMAFSPDGKTLATGGLTDGVRVWEASTGKLMYRLHEAQETASELGLRIHNVAFLPDGKALLTLPEVPIGRAGSVHFWEPATGKRIPQPLGK